ncbi:chromosomal replication initiator protein DnaA [Calothrix sp. PCC 6303]|uniref:chromosomal replication initiator protein DnaA n=1 Tax=Calothrix sp. PCC 6303 TaxID=1170562 RepID=UPI0002A00C1A|nr:chromosomal replication initiator protein DnaA [Calothrix sp. PCC 6303]AFY99113.1 chromosomal replication initiator protein DnaA [Calothrix sp. PCC 6303]
MEISLDSLWSQVLERLQIELSRPTFETWIKTATPEQLENNCLVIRTPNPFAKNWLQKYYLKIIANAVQDIIGHPVDIYLTVAQGDEIQVNQEKDIQHLPELLDYSLKIHQEPKIKTNLNLKYVFSRFVVGANNRMAHAAALAVAESPGKEFNPLFLCGGVGLGKTHLMQAIGHYRLEIDPKSKIFYVSTEQFTNDLITAIRQDKMQNFREHYREADVLLIDDIQFIEDKEYTQEEFFHTFNTLHESGKQVVLASDRPPNQISRLSERLCSRFSMGLIADIQTPDLETRMAILQNKAEYENIRLPKNVIEYIASSYTSNIRELEGALIRVLAHTSIWGLPMTVDSISPILQPRQEKVATTPETILSIISNVFNISLDDLKSNSRRREISWARQIGMYLMRQHTDLSLPRIGEEFGGKDHTTVIYSCDKITQLQKTDQALAQTLQKLRDRINMINRT